MIPIANLFLTEGRILDGFRNSFSNIFGRKRTFRPESSAQVSDQKVDNSRQNYARLVPKPPPKPPVKMGWRGVRTLKNPTETQ